MPSALFLLVAALGAPAARGPWSLLPVDAHGAAAADFSTRGVVIRGVRVITAEGGLVPYLTCWAEVTLAVGPGGPRRLLLATYDADRKPLRGGLIELTEGTDGAVEVPLGMGDEPGAAQFVALGVESIGTPSTSLIATANGGQVLGMSSCYGGAYGPLTLLDGDPATVWASETGQVTDQWFIIGLPAERVIGSIGINPRAEPNYPDCAVRDWELLVSTTGTDEEDFESVLNGVCEEVDELQVAELDEPVSARYLKLLLRTNRGNERWMELAEFEAYAPDAPDLPAEPEVTPLVAVIEDFDRVPAEPADDQEGEVLMLGTGLAPADTGLRVPAMRRGGPAEEAARWAPDPAVNRLAPWPLGRLNCREARCELMTDEDDARRYARLSFDFGNLLGGAPQYFSLILSHPLPEHTARIQLEARAGQSGNLLRSTVWDQNNEWHLFQYAKLEQRGWRTLAIDLDPAGAIMRGGEERNGRLDGALRLMQVSVNPGGRDSRAGTVDIDTILALLAPPEM